MKNIYLDNAATTPIRKEVLDEMVLIMQNDYGNPSSSHTFGRKAKSLLELSRKKIAKILNCSSQEIVFTSCATEANNLILQNVVEDLQIKRIISSKIEHHAVLHTLEALQNKHDFAIDFVKIKSDGSIDIDHLKQLLDQNIPTLVSLMHVNNETGNVLDLPLVSQICQQHQALFHSDTVQSVGKTTINLQEIPIDFIVASAHKFHGPKGIGFAFIRKNTILQPKMFGGEQEKGLRPGTESLHNIVGMASALEYSNNLLSQESQYVLSLKNYLIQKLNSELPGFKINGRSDNFYNILNIQLPFSPEKTSMLLFNLDIKGIAVSRGSACQSGSTKPSHVLAEILSATEMQNPSIRISFSHYNTFEEIDYFVSVLVNL